MKPTILATIALAGVLLVGCDKADTTSNARQATTSPTVRLYASIMKVTTYTALKGEYTTLTEAQDACLVSADADAAYIAPLQAELMDVIGEDGIAESDKFYETDVGKKVLAYLNQQMQASLGQDIGEPITLTPEEQMLAQVYSQNNPKLKVIEEKLAANVANPQAMLKKVEAFKTQEKTRCHIS